MPLDNDTATPAAQAETSTPAQPQGSPEARAPARPAAGSERSPAATPGPDVDAEIDADDADLALWVDEGEESEAGEGEEASEPTGDAAALKAVPESPDGYAIPTVEGVEWNDADKAVFGSVFAAAHEGEITQAGINRLGKWYVEQMAEAKRIEKKRDASEVASTRSAMIDALGEDGFKAEIGKVQKQFAAMPRGLGKEIRDARLPNGTKLGHDVRFIKFLASIENDGPPSAEAREAELVKMMRDDPMQYRKTGQKELAELRAARAGGKPVGPPTQSTRDTIRKAELKKLMQDDPAQYAKTGRAEFAKIIEREEAAKRR